MRSPYLDHVGRIVGGLTPTKGKQSLVGSRQEAVYGCRRLLPQFHISLQYTRSHGRSVGRVLLCVTYRRCLGYEIRDPEVVIHYPWVQDFFFYSQRAHCGSGAYPPSIGCRVLFLWGLGGQGVNLNTHVCVVP